ncbi:MAG: PEP-CTERM sorting domain-containing protein [Planctomycetota bacterium]
MRNAINTLVLVLAFSSVSSAVIVNNFGDVRLVTEPAGIRDFDNGGNTDTGRLIGINTGLVDNFMVFDFESLDPVAGETVSGALVNVFVAQAFSSATHGSDQDIIVLHEMALPNAGWVEGTGIIRGTTNFTDDGSISYANRVTYLPGGIIPSEPWLDDNGQPVANLEEAISQVATTSGYNVGEAPPFITFEVDAATAQGWVDNGIAGLVLSSIDDGDDTSRFNFSASGPTEVQIDFMIGMGGIDGDFNDDGAYDCADVDALVAEIAALSDDTAFDLTGDSFVDGADLDAWLSEAGEVNIGPGRSYLPGDANLDSVVDVSDFGVWNANKFTNVDAWCSGDFNADGVVDVGDFNIWNGNKFTASDAAAVPEPSGMILLSFGLLMLSLKRLR